MTIDDMLQDIERVKPALMLLPDPVRSYALDGLEIAELVIGFLPDEQRKSAMESIKAELRAGIRTAVQAELDASPGGRGT